MLYSITVKPHSKKGPLVIESEGRLVVYLREKPVDGAANEALLRLLADHFQVARTRIHIKSGQRGRQKQIEIT